MDKPTMGPEFWRALGVMSGVTVTTGGIVMMANGHPWGSMTVVAGLVMVLLGMLS